MFGDSEHLMYSHERSTLYPVREESKCTIKVTDSLQCKYIG